MAAIGPRRLCIAEFLIAGEFKGKCQFCHPSPHPEAGQIQKDCSCSQDYLREDKEETSTDMSLEQRGNWDLDSEQKKTPLELEQYETNNRAELPDPRERR